MTIKKNTRAVYQQYTKVVLNRSQKTKPVC